MHIYDIWPRVKNRLRRMRGLKSTRVFPFFEQELPSNMAPTLLEKAENDIDKIIYSHEGRVIHKWLQYPEIYTSEFARYRDKSPKMLEIGVFKGGSLELWRKYFGPSATIYGIDINPECADYVDKPNQVRIGSQADPEFLKSVINEMGTPDIILDDGSHVASHQMISFRTLFPLLRTGGLYVIEDLHTAYEPGFYEGGYKRKNTAIELTKQLVDDMHGWYHKKGGQLAPHDSIKSVRFYDSIVVIEKGDIVMPAHIKVGNVE